MGLRHLLLVRPLAHVAFMPCLLGLVLLAERWASMRHLVVLWLVPFMPVYEQGLRTMCFGAYDLVWKAL